MGLGDLKITPASEIASINTGNGFALLVSTGVPKPGSYDSVEINYTDSSKALISQVKYYTGATLLATITVTYPTATKEVYSWA